MQALMAFLLLALCGLADSKPKTTHEDLANLLTKAAAESFEKLDKVVESIRNGIETGIGQLEDIAHEVEEVSQRQKMYYYCESYTACGQHGECYVPDGTEGPACNCEQFWKGTHCDEMYYYCESYTACGQHGECYVPDGTEGPACNCEQFWKGTHCDEYLVCDAALDAYKLSVANSKPPPGSFAPRCEPDGYYSGMQFEDRRAVCVTKTGEKLSYSILRKNFQDTMTCDCARAEYLANQASGQPSNSLNCAQDGSYNNPAK